MDFSLAKGIFESLYDSIDGYALSLRGRKKLPFYDRGLTYGEIVPDSFFTILKEVEPKDGEMFYDLGSGTGKAVILAALLFNFSKAVGIEIVEDLHHTAEKILVRFNEEIRPTLPNSAKTDIVFQCSDFLTSDFFEANIVFAHSTCFHDGELKVLTKKFENLKEGTRIITVSKSIDSPNLRIIDTQEHPFSWGTATVYFQCRL
ncbi:SAM-dependent methyltransferase [Candidatus Roizmanbacteria bacterium]|nr:SAM-dependent methyltransferase [Candidatus Roizmanbacteria bacterium]